MSDWDNIASMTEADSDDARNDVNAAEDTTPVELVSTVESMMGEVRAAAAAVGVVSEEAVAIKLPEVTEVVNEVLTAVNGVQQLESVVPINTDGPSSGIPSQHESSALGDLPGFVKSTTLEDKGFDCTGEFGLDSELKLVILVVLWPSTWLFEKQLDSVSDVSVFDVVLPERDPLDLCFLFSKYHLD